MTISPVSIYENPDIRPEADVTPDDDLFAVKWVEPESEEAWLALRAQHVTSTEASALFGLSPYGTRFELWHRKKGNVASAFEENERTVWGKRLQDSIAYGVGEERGWKVTAMTEYAYIPSLRMGSSFDFQAYCPQRGIGILEIKNVDYSVYKREWLDGEAPDHIEVQLQHQLEITGYSWGCIAALVGGNTLKVIERERDAEMGAAIRQEVEAFWHTVDLNHEPAPDFTQDAETIARLYSKSGGGEVTSTNPNLERLAKTYLQALSDEKIATGIKESTSAEIKTIIGTADVVFCNGMKINAKAVADNPGTVITADMVGKTINARKGYRPVRITEIKQKGN
jgi:putative phage-type endonuclease